MRFLLDSPGRKKQSKREHKAQYIERNRVERESERERESTIETEILERERERAEIL